MAFDPQTAIALLDTNRATLWPDQATRDEFFNEARSRLMPPRTSDDRKEATKLAIETAKMLLTIAVAVLVATGTIFQFAHTNGVPWVSGTTLLFAITVGLVSVSMISGFVAISSAYKRANGTIDPTGPAWGSNYHTAALGIQSYLGGAALITLIAGLVWWAVSDQPQTSALSLSIPAGNSSLLPKGPLTIDGSWTELRLKTAGNQEIKLPASSTPITLTCK